MPEATACRASPFTLDGNTMSNCGKHIAYLENLTGCTVSRRKVMSQMGLVYKFRNNGPRSCSTIASKPTRLSERLLEDSFRLCGALARQHSISPASAVLAGASVMGKLRAMTNGILQR